MSSSSPSDGDLKMMMNQIMQSEGGNIVAPVEPGDAWTWTAGRIKIEAVLPPECSNEKKVRERLMGLASSATKELIVSEHAEMVAEASQKKKQKATWVEMYKYIGTHSKIKVYKMSPETFEEVCCGDNSISRSYEWSDIGLDVEGPANDPVFVQVAVRSKEEGQAYGVFLVILVAGELQSFIEMFARLPRELPTGYGAVVCWGADQQSAERHMADHDLMRWGPGEMSLADAFSQTEKVNVAKNVTFGQHFFGVPSTRELLRRARFAFLDLPLSEEEKYAAADAVAALAIFEGEFVKTSETGFVKASCTPL